MKNLFTSTVNQKMVDRINKLTPDTKPLWGKMTVAQMLAHSRRHYMLLLAKSN